MVERKLVRASPRLGLREPPQGANDQPVSTVVIADHPLNYSTDFCQ